MRILGLHHITLICRDAQRTVDFYVSILGLRFVKRTVNFDDIGSYHLYFGDETGSPGSAVTFFERPDAPRGLHGTGGTHHFALAVPGRESLLKWKRRLNDLGTAVRGPYDRKYFTSIYFDDPDGNIVEIATNGPGFAVDEPAETLGEADQMPPTEHTHTTRDETDIAGQTWPEPVAVITADMALSRGMHHITAISSDMTRTYAFFTTLLGMKLVKRTFNFDDLNSRHWYWGVDGGRPGTLITYFERDPRRTRRAQIGAGAAHHFALAVADEDELLQWRDKLMAGGVSVSPVMDRTYFKSIYARDPDDLIVEIATLGPGFAVDEPLDALGQTLLLPPHAEAQRDTLLKALKPLTVPVWRPAP